VQTIMGTAFAAARGMTIDPPRDVPTVDDVHRLCGAGVIGEIDPPTFETPEPTEERMNGWDDAGWRTAAAEYHEARGDRVSPVNLDPADVERLRRLLDPTVSIDAAYRQIQQHAAKDLAGSTIDAFRYVVSLRDLHRLRRWLARRPSAERQEFRRMVTQR
jgi:hypothetical protein